MMAGKAVIRCHYRGLLNADPQSEEAKRALAACRENAEALIREGKLMTAALYHYGRQLFLYFEALADECPPEGWMAPLRLTRTWILILFAQYFAFTLSPARGFPCWGRPSPPGIFPPSLSAGRR